MTKLFCELYAEGPGSMVVLAASRLPTVSYPQSHEHVALPFHHGVTQLDVYDKGVAEAAFCAGMSVIATFPTFAAGLAFARAFRARGCQL